MRYDKIVDNRDIVASPPTVKIMKSDGYGKSMKKVIFVCIFKEEEEKNLV